jgi:acyl carrier protein
MVFRDRIADQFRQVAKEQRKRLAPLDDNLLLSQSGLDSLCFAAIVVRLEDELGIDPFHASDARAVSFPVTFADFVARYENAAR